MTSDNVLPDKQEDGAEHHLDRLRQYLRQADGEDSGSRNRQLIRSIKEAVGRVGRAKWEEERNGQGRMAYWRIKVCLILASLCHTR